MIVTSSLNEVQLRCPLYKKESSRYVYTGKKNSGLVNRASSKFVNTSNFIMSLKYTYKKLSFKMYTIQTRVPVSARFSAGCPRVLLCNLNIATIIKIAY